MYTTKNTNSEQCHQIKKKDPFNKSSDNLHLLLHAFCFTQMSTFNQSSTFTSKLQKWNVTSLLGDFGGRVRIYSLGDGGEGGDEWSLT